MSGRHSASDYPEHLNPFKKRSGLRGSFRELKKTLTRTFRRKDDNRSDIETRHHIAAAAPSTRHSDSDSVVLRQNGTPVFKEKEYKSEMYPRSRFSERVAMSRRGQNTSECKDETNPFEDDEVDSSKVADDSITSNSSNVFTKRRRRKKRAPLPPNMLEGSNGLQVPYKSDWSINSYDTDCSSHYCSEADLEHTENKENLREIAEISTEIIGFCKEVNSKDDEVEAKGAMPDLVVSIEGDIRGNSIDEDESKATGAIETHQGDASKSEGDIRGNSVDGATETGLIETLQGDESSATEALQETTNTKSNTGATVIVQVNGDKAAKGSAEVESRDGVTGIVQGDESKAAEGASEAVEGDTGLIEVPQGEANTGAGDATKESNGVVGNLEKHGVNGTIVNSQQQSEIVILDKALEMISDCKVADEVGAASLDCQVDEDEVISDIMDEEELLDICHDHTVDICIPEDTVLDDEVAEDQNNNNHEKQEINYVESKTMYILGSKDDLDKEINFNEKTSLYISGSRDELNEQSNPVPKIRKHKLSKVALLGSADELNATASN